MQSCAAVSCDGSSWHLVNASPDIARQLQHLVPPDSSNRRTNPTAGVFVTNADLDHTLGIFQIREGSQIRVTAPPAVCSSLQQGLRLDAVLSHYGGIEWAEASSAWSGVGRLEVRAAELRGTEPPRYDREAPPGAHAVGYVFRSEGKTAGIFPDVAVLDDELLGVLAECDRVWFDGTFWSENEMIEFNGRTASQMGHVPIEESLPRLQSLGAGRIAFLHINNTNPILRPDSEERKAIIEAGLAIAEDGDHWVG